MAKPTEPLNISFFATGLYTHRSALFSPYRPIGVNVVTYHDAAIDGQDMEIGATLEWGRRPGFARFCSVKLGANEYPLQFYSARQPGGTVLSFVDTNENFSTFTPTSLTSLVTKSTSAQGFMQQIEEITYYANGVDLKKWNGSVSGWGTAAPTNAPTLNGSLPSDSPSFWASNVTVSSVWFGWILDYNGNIEFTDVTSGSFTTGPVEPNWSIVVTPPLGATVGAAAQGGITLDGTLRWRNCGPVSAAVWAASAAVGLQAFLIDNNGNLQEATALSGPSQTGTTQPVWNATVGGTTTDNDVTWTNRGPSTLSVQAGYTYAYGYRTSSGHLSTLSPLFTIGAVMGALSIPLTGMGSADPQCTNVEIYRTADGGGVLYLCASIANPGASPWTFTDTIPDPSLNIDLIGPLAHLNDPPPGTPGSLVTQGGTILAYWQGRIWMAVGNKLYFDAGPDCINGVPEESWPPANVFSYDGPITGLKPTSQGLLVWGADYLSMALGGPQTLSFFPYDLMKNFGVSSPNCIGQDGDTISALLTSGQCFTLNDSGKSETGNYIVNLLDTFAAAASYVAIHRNGTDSGLWLGDGSTNLFRYSLSIGAWSTEYKPVGGIGALNSIETSVGVYTLCAGRTTGGGYILGRSLSTWQDDGQNYSNCFVTIGSITLTPPGSTLVPVQHIVGYFDAAGTLGPVIDPRSGRQMAPSGGPTVPTVAILPNEQSGLVGPGFLTLGQPKSEYTTSQVLPTQSMLSLRWDVDSMNVQSLVSQWMHHLQIKFSFPPENAPNKIKTISILFDKDK